MAMLMSGVIVRVFLLCNRAMASLNRRSNYSLTANMSRCKI